VLKKGRQTLPASDAAAVGEGMSDAQK